VRVAGGKRGAVQKRRIVVRSAEKENYFAARSIVGRIGVLRIALPPLRFARVGRACSGRQRLGYSCSIVQMLFKSERVWLAATRRRRRAWRFAVHGRQKRGRRAGDRGCLARATSARCTSSRARTGRGTER